MSVTSESYLSVYLGDSKKPWLAYCAKRNLKPGAQIRAAVDAELARVKRGVVRDDAGGTIPAVVAKDESPDYGKKKRLELRLTPSELQVLKALADGEGCSHQVWAVNALRGVMTRQPQIGMKEYEALGESNYQLLAIGRNLNQLAKRLNQLHVEPVSVEKIEALTRIIEKHTRQVSKVMGASLERWSLA